MNDHRRLVGPPLADFADGPVGLGERLEIDPSTGSATLTVPLPFATDRTGAAPPLTLVHAGGGNSPFGLGWSLTVPSVERVGDRGLPRYDDTDRFVVAGIGEVSPALVDDGDGWRPAHRRVGAFEVRRHAPVVGHPTHVIEQWIYRPTATSSWRVEGADGTVAVYGEGAAARLADPDDPGRIATWYLERSWDQAGNAFAYTYKTEDFAEVSRQDPAEAARIRRGVVAGTNLKRVHYGNRVPFDPDDPGADVAFRLEVVLDYGEHDTGDPATAGDETGPWAVRPDPFSRYRGFEVRTYRRCRGLLLFNRYPALSAAAQLTDVVALDYGEDDDVRAGSRLRSIERWGHRAEREGWWQASAPLTFTYAAGTPADEASVLATTDGRPLATSEVPQWVDVFGEGIRHLLYRRSGAWAFRPNRGGGLVGGEMLLDELPSAAMAGVGALGDVESDGTRDLVVATPETAGFHALESTTRSWDPLHAFEQVARVGGVATGTVDCSGDGRADALVGGQDDVVWFESDGAGGDRLPQRVIGTEDGPPQLQASPGRGIYLLDMNGDGLADVVRVRNGEATYWPSLGHGRFGPALAMADAPRFDHDELFDPLRLRFVDLDGSGTPDVLYLGGDGVRLWRNRAGNGFGPAQRIDGLPTAHAAATAEVVDLLADGTLCLVWTSMLPGDAGAPVRYLPLMAEGPPGQLVGYANGRGGEVRLEHGSSARMYLDALDAGRPWSLPIGVHPTVVTRVERIDHVTGAVTHERFAYHDAVSDPDDGGFATFAFVERRDTEPADPPPELAADEHVSAAVVRTWFHPGERIDDPALRGRWSSSTFADDPFARGLASSAVDDATLVEADRGEGRPTQRAALRALVGRPLRQETFAAADLAHPYQVSETRFAARPQQPASSQGAGRWGATAVIPAETLIHVYDGAAEDPRIEHTIHLDVDRYGRDQRIVTIAYGRRADRAVHPDQELTHVTVEETDAADLVGDPSMAPGDGSRRSLGLLLERRRYDLVGLERDPDGYVTPETLRPQVDTALGAVQPFDTDLSGATGPAARLTEWERHRYADAVGDATTDPATMDVPARLERTMIAAFPQSLVAAELPADAEAAELDRLGYEHDAGHWWRAGPRREYRPAAEFHLLRRSTDAFGAAEELELDDELRALAAVVDGLGLRTSYATDYVTLEPTRRTDENDVVAEVRFDPLRRVRCRSARGRTRVADGSVAVAGDEPLLGHIPRPDASLDEVLADPGAFVQGAAAAAHYDDRAWHDHVAAGGDLATAPPATVAILSRTRHHRTDPGAPIEAIVSHYDGAGNACQRKRRVDDGPAFVTTPAGTATEEVADRWLCTGRAARNNKGLPRRTFASLHTDGPAYEPEALFAAVGMATRLSYDPMGRLVRTETPAGFHSEAERGAWVIRTFDENDTVERSHAFTVRVPAGEITDPATLAGIEAARAHRDTPTVAHLDAKGRPFLMWALAADSPIPLQTHHRYTAAGHTERLVDPRQFAKNAARPADQQVASARFVRDMQGVPMVEETVDAGALRLLVDVLQRPVHRWDARGVHLANTYDAGGRLTEVRARAPGDSAPVTIERYRYGDGAAGGTDDNQRGRLVEVDDQAGRRTIERYDHEGRALETTRRFAAEYRTTLDWSANPALEGETFVSRTAYDALGRVVRHERPDGSVQETTYAPGGTTARVRVVAANGTVDQEFLAGVAHDARGQRTEERHGNGTTTTLAFDVETSRLRHQTTATAARTLAEVTYGYDPVGNLTERDARTRRHLITNLPAVPADQQPERFTYDALYRLVEATGWTHEALDAGDSAGLSPGAFQGTRHLSLNNGQLLRRYRRRYSWDAAGNLEELRHTSAAGNFTRTMWIDDRSNRSITRDRPDGTLRPDPAGCFDAAGQLTTLDRLRRMRWDHHGRLVSAVVIERPAPGFDDAEYYVHAAGGVRARRVEERLDHGQRLVIETRYLPGCSITRRRRGNTDELERRTALAEMGARRLGFVHHWTLDNRRLEVDAAGTTAVRYALTVQGGHSHLVVDETAAVVSYEEHTPFGETSFVAGDRVRDLLPRRDRFAGRERDDVTGFLVFPFRSYAPCLCRWVSPDPLGIADGPNLYGFVHGNPVTHRDDLGLDTEEERKRAEWRQLVGSAVSFESLPEEVQARARGGWLTASELGLDVYVDDPRFELERITDPEEVNQAIAAGEAVAIRTIPPERARFERTMDVMREVMRPLDELTAQPSPWDLDVQPVPGPRPIGDESGGTTDPARPPEDTTSPPPADPSGTPPLSSTGDRAGNDPSTLPVTGVSVSAVGKAAQNLPDATPSTRPPVADRVPNELPDDALRWGDSEAARRDLLNRPEFRDGRVPADFGRDVPEGVRPNQLDPHGPAVGEFGHVAQHSEHHSAERPDRRADYVDQDDLRSRRLTEREHGDARRQLEELSHVPGDDPQYTQHHYDNDVTVWTERDTALNKTHGNRGGPGADNPTTARMRAHREAGGAHDFVETFDDARANYHRAIADTGSTVPTRSADIGIFHQMSNASGMNSTAETAARLPEGAAEDIDGVLARLDESDAFRLAGADAPHIPDVPVPSGGTRALQALKSGGKVALEALGPLGTGLSVYAYATARTTEDRILTGADLTADLVGYAGPVGAAFSISYGVTRAVDDGIAWASKKYLGRDLSPSSVTADGMLAVDQALTSLWADPSKPAYTQTIGWKLAEFFDSL